MRNASWSTSSAPASAPTRSCKIALENDDPFVPLLIERKAGETQLFVKQVKVEGVRYVVCRNEAEAENDRKDREAIVAALDAQLKKGDKALIGNSAYRRYLRKAGPKGERSFEIDAGKLAEEARFDGIFVLRTNAKIAPLQAVLRYRDLLQVEVSQESANGPMWPLFLEWTARSWPQNEAVRAMVHNDVIDGMARAGVTIFDSGRLTRVFGGVAEPDFERVVTAIEVGASPYDDDEGEVALEDLF